MKELANSVTTTTGAGINYTPGPRKVLKFPFNYLDTFTAFYASTINTGNNFNTYDGYGTLITPWGTYTNVVRIKTMYTSTIGYAINWYILSPLLSILSYDSNSNTFTGLSATPTGTEHIVAANESVLIAPNPFEQSATITLSCSLNLTNAFVSITDMTGKIVKQIPVNGRETSIQKGELTSGVYGYQVFNAGVNIANGRLIIK